MGLEMLGIDPVVARAARDRHLSEAALTQDALGKALEGVRRHRVQQLKQVELPVGRGTATSPASSSPSAGASSCCPPRFFLFHLLWIPRASFRSSTDATFYPSAVSDQTPRSLFVLRPAFFR